jgi:CheY-like chemotaxis protein
MEGKVLVVDDEASLRLVLKNRLLDKGFQVEVASDGNEALAKLREQSFDVVLLDINMPGMNGIQVLEHAVTNYPETEVVMLTGFADFSMAIDCIKKGAKDYLIKPIDPAELIARLESLMRAHTSERALNEYRQTCQSTLLFEVYGALRTIGMMLEYTGKESLGAGQAFSTSSLPYAFTINERVLGRLKEMVSPQAIAGTPVPLRKDPVMLSDLITRACERYSPCARADAITLQPSLDVHLPVVQCDRDRIEQVLNALFETAINGSPSGSTISVGLTRLHRDTQTRQDDSLVCTVTHQGISVSTEEIAHIRTLFDGTGAASAVLNPLTLNLSIASRIVKGHGGFLDIEHRGNKETVLRFTIPIR